VDAASRKFFGHSGTQLSLPEAAIIAGLVKAPSHYSPTADAQAAVDRASVVLDVMEDAGSITPSEHAAVHLDKVKMAAEPAQNSVRYFTDWALPQLDTLIGTDNTSRSKSGPRSTRKCSRRHRRRRCQRPQGRTGRAGVARPRWRGAGDGRRHRLRHQQLQPRHQCHAPARLGVEAVRLSGRAGIRREARRSD
jgi:hypothetical protein